MDNNFIVVHTMKRQGGYEMMNIVRLSIMAVLVALVASQMTATYAQGNRGQGINHSKIAQIIAAESQGTAAGVPKTGQETTYSPRDDGDLKTGVDWPTPRFTDNPDGTITDELTGLIWDKNANRFGVNDWATALDLCKTLDETVEGDWRLPNVRELHSLVHYGEVYPAVPNSDGGGQGSDGDPFDGIAGPWRYWTSTNFESNPLSAWYVFFDIGTVFIENKGEDLNVWCVKGN